MQRQTRSLAWAAILLVALTFVLLRPILLPLVLAAWFARLVRPVRDWLPFRRSIAAVLLTGVLLVGVAGPVLLLLELVGQGVVGLVDAIATSKGLRGALVALVSPGTQPIHMERIQRLLQHHSQQAPDAAGWLALFGLATLLFFFFLALGSVALISQGERLFHWARLHQPLKPEHFDRLAAAFTETGRGLFAYVGLTCLSQGILCTVTFLALGIPRAFGLGFICSLFAVLPVVGTPLVWGPVAAGLFLTGASAKGTILVLVGVVIIGAVEIVIGPLFSKVGRFQLSGPLILIGMFGGTFGLGPSGLFLGPLILRLAKEALSCAREARVVGSTARRVIIRHPRPEGNPTQARDPL